MRFGPVPIDRAEGAILAHSTSVGGRRLKKGHRLAADDLILLREAGVAEVIAAEIEPDELLEDAAAERVARAAQGENTRLQAAFTGRANLYAESPGLAVIDAARVDRLNLQDESLTIATIAPYEAVEPGQMLATVKVIPFAARRDLVERCAAIAADGGPLVRVAPFRPYLAGLAMTRLPGTKDSVLAKTEQAVTERLVALGSNLGGSFTVAHETAALKQAIHMLLRDGLSPILIFGATAIVDRRDIVPAAIEAAGGKVLHFGMPVDPGNLLLLGRIGETPVVGVPGCARSPKLNGFDWVLQRMLAGLEVGREDIMRMGAGGLLKEIPTRPQPREAERPLSPRAARIAALVLAAGQSRRMGRNKLLEPIDGKPMIAHTVEAIAASAARPIVVVLGNEAEKVRAALSHLPVEFVENADYADGLSTSLRRGIERLPDSADGALVCLGDMPRVKPAQIDRLIAAFNPTEGRAIVVPTWTGKRGNPVLFGAQFFHDMRTVAGDVGARHLIGLHQDEVREVPMEDDAVLIDIDTPDALARLRSAEP